VTSLPFPLQCGARKLFSRARQGLYQALRQLGLARGGVALVPAYHHGSEIEAYLRAGVDLRFYDVGATLAPDPAELDRRFDDRVRVLHLTHYFGFDQDVERWRSWCDQRGVHLVEDAAQGWLGRVRGRPLGSLGDVSLFSLYKTFGVPDGGAVALHGTMLHPSGPGPLGLRAAVLKHGAWLARQWSPLGAVRVRRRASRPYVAEKDFDLGDPARAATKVTTMLIPRLLTSAIAETRASHVRRLLDDLRPWVPEPLRRDPEELSPYTLPVLARDKTRSLGIFLDQGIGAINAWSVPHPSLPVVSYPGAAQWRSRVLLLPVHQELQARDLDRIASTARSALGSPP
jgi:dTDP-4-amino-4,6-dideoxygalactose transaminase